MRTWTAAFAGGVVASCLACAGTVESHPVRGSWEVVARAYTRSDSSWTNTSPEPGLYLFGERDYGVQEIRESGPRAVFAETTTDAERLAAFEVFHAHAGTYVATDSTLTITPLVAKGPNTMDGSSFTYGLRVVGDTMTVTRRVPGEARITVLVRRR